MVDSDSDWRHAGGLSTLALPLPPEETTLQIPITPGVDHERMPWVEPRRVGADGPVWDATDEIYITYDKDGNRDVVTTGERDIYNREHSYQRTGSARYDALKSLGQRAGSAVGERARAVAGRLRPGWAGGDTREWPPVDADRDGVDPRERSRGGARTHHSPGGDGALGAPRHARHSSDRRRLPQRPGDASAEQRVRSHRHCPGCAGHGATDRGGWELLLRGGAGWLLGWIAIWIAGVGLSFGQYAVLTVLGTLAVLAIRPVWRELVSSQDRYSKGGRR